MKAINTSLSEYKTLLDLAQTDGQKWQTRAVKAEKELELLKKKMREKEPSKDAKQQIERLKERAEEAEKTVTKLERRVKAMSKDSNNDLAIEVLEEMDKTVKSLKKKVAAGSSGE